MKWSRVYSALSIGTLRQEENSLSEPLPAVDAQHHREAGTGVAVGPVNSERERRIAGEVNGDGLALAERHAAVDFQTGREGRADAPGVGWDDGEKEEFVAERGTVNGDQPRLIQVKNTGDGGIRSWHGPTQ